MTAALLESADGFVSAGAYDWYDTKAGTCLHWAELSEEQRADIPSCWAVLQPVRLACGRTAASLHIPGMFSRMGAPRCSGCCRSTGLPVGIGSPKNSGECRKILGAARERISGMTETLGVGAAAHAVADAARSTPEIIARYGDRPVFMSGCVADNATFTDSGIRVEAGGSIRAGNVILRDGAIIRALDEGGFVIETCDVPEPLIPSSTQPL